MINIRPAEQNDLPKLYQLIKELAEFERAPEAVSNSIEQMLSDGFGPNKIFDAFVAEFQNEIIGMAITYYRYSTWKGKSLYLEDLIINQKHRGRGAGKALFEHCIAFGKKQNCIQMNWQVLDWNETAMGFYRQYGTLFDDEWINCNIPLRV